MYHLFWQNISERMGKNICRARAYGKIGKSGAIYFGNIYMSEQMGEGVSIHTPHALLQQLLVLLIKVTMTLNES